MHLETEIVIMILILAEKFCIDFETEHSYQRYLIFVVLQYILETRTCFCFRCPNMKFWILCYHLIFVSSSRVAKKFYHERYVYQFTVLIFLYLLFGKPNNCNRAPEMYMFSVVSGAALCFLIIVHSKNNGVDGFFKKYIF